MHHVAHVVDGERVAQEVVAHARPGGVGHLGLLQMEAGLGERAERAGMVVVQVGDDNLLDVAGGNADLLERGGRRPVHLAAALGALGRVEARVDDDGALGVADDPDEIVDGVGAVVVVGGDEALEAPARGQARHISGPVSRRSRCSSHVLLQLDCPATMVAKPTSVIIPSSGPALQACCRQRLPPAWCLQGRSRRREAGCGASIVKPLHFCGSLVLVWGMAT